MCINCNLCNRSVDIIIAMQCATQQQMGQGVFVCFVCVCVDVFVSMGLCPLCRDRMAGEMVS